MEILGQVHMPESPMGPASLLGTTQDPAEARPYTGSAPSSHSETAALWEVVGGEDKGGIIVRTGIELTSPQEKKRLSFGSVVRGEQLIGDRLRYTRVKGMGPLTGWVSLAVNGSGKALVVRLPKGREGMESHTGVLEDEAPGVKQATENPRALAPDSNGVKGARANYDFAGRKAGVPVWQEEAPGAATPAALPSVEELLAAIDSSGENEMPAVPALEDVLAALEKDEQEDRAWEDAAKSREEFFNLSAPSSLSIPSGKQWWEPKLRLDGPNYSFRDVALVGRHSYAKDRGELLSDGVFSADAPSDRPPEEWFRSTSSMEVRLSQATLRPSGPSADRRDA